MTSPQHLVLTSVVTYDRWRSGADDVLRGVHTSLRERADLLGLRVDAEPLQDVRILPCATRVRVTLTADGVPSA